MMDVDDLIEQSQSLLEQEDYTQAKACLRKAAELAPLRNDLRDMLTYAIEQEAVAISKNAKRSRKAKPKSQSLLMEPPPNRGRRLLTATIWITLSIACLGLGVYLVANRDALTDFFKSKTVVTATPTPSGPVIPTETPEPTKTPTPAPTADPLEIKRHELLADAVALANLNKFDQAVEKMEAILATSPSDDANYRTRLAGYHFRIGEEAELALQYDKAMQHFESAIKQDPTKAEYHSHLGYIHYRKGCLLAETNVQRASYFEKARTSLTTAIKLDPNYLRTYSTLALTHIKLLDKNSALECYRQVIQRAGEGSPEALQATRQMRMIQ